MISLINACAQLEPIPDTINPKLAKSELNDANLGWYATRFSLPRKKGKEPQWHLGTLLAGEVILPLLDQYGQKIVHWRLHRRAADDQTGHVFSLIFYSSKVTATSVFQAIKKNQLLTKLHEQQRVLKINYETPVDNTLASRANTSDPGWPDEVRKTWPLFMMGASQMWLAQVKIFKKESEKIHGIEQRYQHIQDKMNLLWQHQGQHALIHHLSALYAYQPVSIQF